MQKLYSGSKLQDMDLNLTLLLRLKKTYRRKQKRKPVIFQLLNLNQERASAPIQIKTSQAWRAKTKYDYQRWTPTSMHRHPTTAP